MFSAGEDHLPRRSKILSKCSSGGRFQMGRRASPFSQSGRRVYRQNRESLGQLRVAVSVNQKGIAF